MGSTLPLTKGKRGIKRERSNYQRCLHPLSPVTIKEALYRIWCGANRLGDSGVHALGDNSAFVYPAGQLLLPGGVRPEWIPSA